jgi:hypothetical protein
VVNLTSWRVALMIVGRIGCRWLVNIICVLWTWWNICLNDCDLARTICECSSSNQIESTVNLTNIAYSRGRIGTVKHFELWITNLGRNSTLVIGLEIKKKGNKLAETLFSLVRMFWCRQTSFVGLVYKFGNIWLSGNHFFLLAMVAIPRRFIHTAREKCRQKFA